MTKSKLEKAVSDVVQDLMLLVLGAYEPLEKEEWFALTRLAFEDASALPDPETFHTTKESRNG